MTNPNSSLNSSEDPPPSQWKCTKVKGIHIPCKNPWLAPAVVFTDVSNCMPMCARHCTRPKGKIVSKIQFQLKILKEFKTPREVPQFSLVLSWFFPQLKAHRELTHGQTRTIWCNFQTLQDALELWKTLWGLEPLYGETWSPKHLYSQGQPVLETKAEKGEAYQEVHLPTFQGSWAESL